MNYDSYEPYIIVAHSDPCQVNKDLESYLKSKNWTQDNGQLIREKFELLARGIYIGQVILDTGGVELL